MVLAGLAGLAAGAFSMAAGEYTSVASQSEAAAARDRQGAPRDHRATREGETAELAEMYVEKGLDPELAAEVARQIHADVDNAVAVHAREELGVDPDDLASPDARGRCRRSLSFAVGALIPVLPYLLGATSLLPGLVVHTARAVRLRRGGHPGHQRGPGGTAACGRCCSARPRPALTYAVRAAWSAAPGSADPGRRRARPDLSGM